MRENVEEQQPGGQIFYSVCCYCNGPKLMKLILVLLWVLNLSLNAQSQSWTVSAHNRGAAAGKAWHSPDLPSDPCFVCVRVCVKRGVCSARAFAAFCFNPRQFPQFALWKSSQIHWNPFILFILLRAATKIKAESRLVKNCADRNLIGWDEYKRLWAIKIYIPTHKQLWGRLWLFTQVKLTLPHYKYTPSQINFWHWKYP